VDAVKGVLTFTNLFPSAAMPTHGLFVQERMRRVMARLREHGGETAWQVVAPVPRVPSWFPAGDRRFERLPEQEVVGGVTVHHPRYRHWPGLVGRQAAAMAAGALPTVAGICRSGRWVIDAHYLWPDGVAAAEIARQLELPLLLTARGSDLNVLAGRRGIAARIATAGREAFACLAVSGALCDRFAAVTGLRREHVVEVRNGVDLERFRPGDRNAARARLGLPLEGRLLLGVGRLVSGKGFDVAVRALAMLPPDVSLALVGDGPERQPLLAAGGGRVHCLGALGPDLVAEAYRTADLLVLPSEREGWPNVVTEALASGLRVVATRVGGMPEILGDPRPDDRSLGALVEPGDDAAFAAAIASVLSVPADGAQVRAFAERWSWEQPVRMLAGIVQQALEAER
jgi:glycosyltransferase involved in cell wall biosynthesis